MRWEPTYFPDFITNTQLAKEKRIEMIKKCLIDQIQKNTCNELNGRKSRVNYKREADKKRRHCKWISWGKTRMKCVFNINILRK